MTDTTLVEPNGKAKNNSHRYALLIVVLIFIPMNVPDAPCYHRG